MWADDLPQGNIGNKGESIDFWQLAD